MSGRADEVLRQRFLKAWKDGDPKLHAIFNERKEKALRMMRILDPQGPDPLQTMQDIEDVLAQDEASHADASDSAGDVHD
jgi:hypothetical protein